MFNHAEERQHLSWLINQDGLWDIFLGLGVLGLALDMAFGTSIWFIPLWLVGYSLALLVGKELVTKPRIGNLVVSSQPKIQLGNALTVVVLLGLMALVGGGVIFILQMKGSITWFVWVAEYTRLIIGSLAAIGFSLLGYFSIGGKRYYIYALLTFIAFAMRHITSAPLWPCVLFTAALLFVPGVVLLLRFLHKYPKIEA
jgi:hypothetical protein